MPFERRTTDLTEGYRELADEIERVLREQNPSPQTSDEPCVIWEENRYLNRINVTVVWDRWEGVDPEARGRIIIDAVEKAKGQPTSSRVTLALGVTKEQAQRMGIR